MVILVRFYIDLKKNAKTLSPLTLSFRKWKFKVQVDNGFLSITKSGWVIRNTKANYFEQAVYNDQG